MGTGKFIAGGGLKPRWQAMVAHVLRSTQLHSEGRAMVEDHIVSCSYSQSASPHPEAPAR